MFKLSIITINKNNVNGLRSTIESVLMQNFLRAEYILIDGGSTDGSVEVIKEFADRLTFWISESDTGIYNAMNKGIKRATGDYCLFLNSGDVFYNNNVIKNVFDLNFKEELVYGQVIYVNKNKQIISETPDSKSLTFRHFINSTLPHPGVFIKRDLFNKIGYYDENYLISSDFDFFLSAIFINGATLRSIPDIISVFDMNGMSSQPENSQVLKEEREKILIKHFPRFLPDYTYMDELEYKTQHNFWAFIAKVMKSIKKK